MNNIEEKIRLLKDYFSNNPNISMAFVFGSQAAGLARRVSDWDIGVYFRPKEYLELETEEDYPDEHQIWSDLIDILETDDVDFVVLNRARPSLVYNVLRIGLPLKMADKKLYWDLLCKVSYEAMDWWRFVNEYYKIREEACSLSEESIVKTKERLVFLEEQFKDIERFKKLSFDLYRTDRNERRNVERWIENLVMASLDIAKIILASEKKEIPQSYKDTLKVFAVLYLDPSMAEKFSQFTELRNIVVHEYIDIRWKRIENFVRESEKIYPQFIEKVKKIVE